MEKHIASYLKCLKLERNYSVHTLNSYRNDLEQINTYAITALGIDSLTDMKHVHVRSWIIHLMGMKYSHTSINRKLSTLRSYYKYLMRQSIVDSSPMTHITALKLPKRLPKALPQPIIEKVLLDHNSSDTYRQWLTSLIIELLYSTGLRRAELISLKSTDINYIRAEIKVLGKGNKERIIPISPQLVKTIEKYQELKSKKFPNHDVDSLLLTDRGKPLYPKYVYNIVCAAIRRHTTTEAISPHVLRHSFATHMADAGADLNSIKDIMGHSSLASTELYLRSTIERLQGAYQTAHPRADEF